MSWIKLARVAAVLSVMSLPAICFQAKAQDNLLFPEVAAGSYATARDYFIGHVRAILQPRLAAEGFDETFINRFGDCAWTAFDDQLTPELRTAFDAHARGVKPMDGPTWSRAVEVFGRIFNGKQDGLVSLAPYCPDVVGDFRAKAKAAGAAN